MTENADEYYSPAWRFAVGLGVVISCAGWSPIHSV